MKFANAIKVTLLLASLQLAQPIALAQRQTIHDEIIRDVRDTAKRHAESGSGKDSKYVLDLYESNSVGVTRQEILRAYDETYTKSKEEHEKRDWVPKAGWIMAGLLFVALIFLDRLKEWCGKLISFVGEKLFNFFAALPLFNQLALKKYSERMIERHSKLKIPFRPDRPLELKTVFVPLKVTAGTEPSGLIDADSALAKNPRMVVKGAPGSGKSIFLRHIALTYARRLQLRFSKDRVPILVELNRLNDPTVKLRAELTRELMSKGFPKPDRFLERGLNHGALLLLLDGLDEVSAPQRPAVLRQIKDVIEDYPLVRVVVTCRTQVYSGELDGIVDNVLEIQSFTDQQIRNFLRAWAPGMKMHGKSVDQLMTALLERPAIMLLARNPLMLTIIAWLYTDTNVILPQSRSEFYRKATELLLYDWKPETNQFPLTPKQLVLKDLALHFQDSADQRQTDRRSVDVQTVINRISTVLPSLNINSQENALPILNEIVQRSGLLLAIDGGERYQFAHLTLQEYFAAAELRSQPDGLIERFRLDPDAWREPVKLWCGLGEDATDFVQSVYDIDPITALECLADAQKVKATVAAQIIESMKAALLSDTGDPALVKAFATVASSLSDRGKSVFTWLSSSRAPEALNSLSYTNTPQAAKILASLCSQMPSARPLLCRLGELAVPELMIRAEAGDSWAVDDLLTIGTPGAAEALTPLLWHDSSEIGARASYALAALFQLPEVFSALGDLSLNHQPEMEWVWKPFQTDEKSAIPVIAGRIAFLLQSAHSQIGLPEAKLDPRLVLPVCATTSKDLIPRESPSEYQKLQLAELYLKVAGAEASKQLRLDAEDHLSLEKVSLIADRLLDTLHPSLRWRFLANHLDIGIRAELVRGISSTRPPTREDWLNILRPVSYRIDRSWHMWTVFAAALSVATFDIVYLVRFGHLSSPIWASLYGGLAWGALVHGVVLLSSLGAIEYLAWAALGPFLILHKTWDWSVYVPDETTVWLNIAKLAFAFVITLGTALWIPAWILASYFAGAFLLNPAFAVTAVAAVLSILTLLVLRARQLERRSRNPLSGLKQFLLTDAKSKFPVDFKISVAAAGK